jgi:YD repeat-containing protein
LASGQEGAVSTFAYDQAGQVTAERRSGPGAYAATYAYDPAGNRLAQADAAAGRTTSLYDAANQLLREDASGGRTTYGYDACGGRSRKEAPAALTVYAWDDRHRLASAEPPAGPVTLAHDPDGRRLSKQAPGGTTGYLYDFENVLRESDGAGALVRDYLSTAEQYGELLSAFDGAHTSQYQGDALGSAEALVDESASVTDRYRYRAFGLAEHTTGASPQPFTFVGQKGYQQDTEIDLYAGVWPHRRAGVPPRRSHPGSGGRRAGRRRRSHRGLGCRGRQALLRPASRRVRHPLHGPGPRWPGAGHQRRGRLHPPLGPGGPRRAPGVGRPRWPGLVTRVRGRWPVARLRRR